jgi:hypothetical protein
MTSEEAVQRATGKATAQCRGCERWIVRLEAGWVDVNGFFACVKGPLPPAGKPFETCVVHQPMPEGLRGAPS